MADDIVQTVKLEGVDETVSGFKKVEDAGASAMAGIGKAVPTASKAAGEFRAKIVQIEEASRQFGSSLRDFGSASQKFASNVGRMGASVAKYAAATGLGMAAIKKFSNASQEQSEDLKQAVGQNRSAAQAQTNAAMRALDNEKAQRELTTAFQQGKMTVTEYGKALMELQRTQALEGEFARRREAIQASADDSRKQEEAALKRQAAANKAYSEAVKAYGADAANALSQLAPAYERFMQKLNEGPSLIADIMRGFTMLFNQHGEEIVKIVNQIGNSFGTLFTDATAGGDRAQGFADTMISAIRAVGSAITGYLIPTIKGIIAVFQPVADVLNRMFGTQLTGGIIAAGAALVIFSGALPAIAAGITTVVYAFKALNLALAALGSLTPMGVAIRVIIVALALLVTHWDEVKTVVGGVVDYVKTKWQEWATWFQGFIDSSKQTWDEWVAWIGGLWDGLVETAKAAAAGVLKVFLNLIPGLVPLLNFFEKLRLTIADTNAEAAKTGNAAPEGKKRGGPIGGGGTSTSDSVPIMASRGEWVIRAQAAHYYGRRFMSMVNSMRLPRSMPSMADALVMPSTRTHFAMGGEVGTGERAGSRILNLTLPGLGSFPGLTGPDDTMDRLQVAAVRSQIRSAGRLPGWYGGR